MINKNAKQDIWIYMIHTIHFKPLMWLDIT